MPEATRDQAGQDLLAAAEYLNDKKLIWYAMTAGENGSCTYNAIAHGIE
jgi:hypothetical protein